jgi:hypothetical protein
MVFSIKKKRIDPLNFQGTLGVIRTRDPLLRKQVLYPLSYEGKLHGGEGGIRTHGRALFPTTA